MLPSDVQFYMDELESNGCQCGNPKRPGQPLCYNCYKRLPLDLQRGLCKAIRSGYAEAYEAAVKWLER